MATSPPPQRDRKMSGSGMRLLAIGAVLIVIGLVVTIPLEGTAAGIGWALIALGCVPAVAGIALVGSSFVSRWSRANKPFA
jgi:hypothetical protein